MSKISELSNGGALLSTDDLIVVRSGGNVRAQLSSLNGIAIGGSTPAAGSFTTGSFSGNVTVGGDIEMASNQIIFNNNSQAIQIRDAAGTASYVLYQDNADTLIVGNGTNVESIRFDVSGNESALKIASDGNLGIGESNPLDSLSISSSAGNAAIRLKRTDTTIVNDDIYGAINFAGDDSDTNASGIRGFIRGRAQGTGGGMKMEFHTAGGGAALASDPRMTLNADGNLGIGESSPLGKLHVKTADSGATADASADELVIEGSANAGISILSGASSNGNIYFGDSGTNWDGYIAYSQAVRRMTLGVAAGGNSVNIDSTGVGIGDTNPTQKLTVNGNINVASGSGYMFGTGAVQMYSNSSYLRMRTNSTDRLEIDSNGTVYGGNYFFIVDTDTGILRSSANEVSIRAGGNDRWVVTTSGVSTSGSLSKGSGSFKIDHPLPAKTDTHHLVHSFVEAPQADNIYRGSVDLVGGSATVNIDTAAGMTDGTFVLLNTNVQCFTSNESGWTAIKGSVSGNTLTITAQDNTCTDTISWMVVGERHDQHMLDTEWTDENGKVIVEPIKPVIEE